jgi:hypothetical protein
MAALLVVQSPPLSARQRDVVKTDWAALTELLAKDHSPVNTFRFWLLDGDEFAATLLRIDADGIVVRVNKSTKRWATIGSEAKLPRVQVVALCRSSETNSFPEYRVLP